MAEGPAGDARRYWWMWPAWQVGRIRPGLAAATVADARRLRTLPALVGGVLLPLAAIVIPTVLSAIQATTVPSFQGPPENFALIIYDVFTESIPFMVVALAIGLAAPAAGALLVLAYGVGNVAATIVTGELEPPIEALFGRLVSFLVLWILVVEIPLAGRYLFEWASADEAGPRGRRTVAVAVAALVVTVMVQIWSLAAPLLITVVFYLTRAWGTPFLRATLTLSDSSYLLVGASAVLALVLLGVRYLGERPMIATALDDERPSSPAARLLSSVIGIGIMLVLLSSSISQPIDAIILVVGLALGKPIASLVLRATRLAPLLVRIPWPIRLILGFGVALGFSVAFIGVLGASTISRWFNVVIAIAVSYVIVEVFLAADDVVEIDNVDGEPEAPSVGTVIAAALPLLSFLFLALPAVAQAHGWGDQPDIDNLKAAGAAAAAGGTAAAIRKAQGRPHGPKFINVTRSAKPGRGPKKNDTPKETPPQDPPKESPPEGGAPKRDPDPKLKDFQKKDRPQWWEAGGGGHK